MSNEISEVKPVEVGSLVSYQTGSIVSRQILKRDKGNVTLFALDQNQVISEHTTPYDAMAVLLEGEAEITVSGHPHIVRTGELLLMPALQPHALKAIRPFKMMLLMIRS